MRYAALILTFMVLTKPVYAAVTPEIDPRASLSVVQQWIYNYRGKPDPVHVPAAVRVLFHSQTFREPENAGIYLGFMAGAIGSNPAKAEQLVNSFFPVPPEDEWVIVRAIAYSDLPEWRNLLRQLVSRAVELEHLRADLDIEQFVWELGGIYLAHHAAHRFLRQTDADQRARTATRRRRPWQPR